jgi:hypothetical protein
MNANALNQLAQAQRADQLVGHLQQNLISQAQRDYNLQYGSEGSEEELDSEK